MLTRSLRQYHWSGLTDQVCLWNAFVQIGKSVQFPVPQLGGHVNDASFDKFAHFPLTALKAVISRPAEIGSKTYFIVARNLSWGEGGTEVLI